MQFEKSGLRIIGTVGLMLGLSVGCSAPPKPQVAMQSVNCTLPEFAEGFRWRSCGGASDSGVKCLEILDAQRAAVMTTVYQDSAHWRNDSSIPTSEVVVLGEAEGLTTLSSTHVALIEVWNPSLSEWKGGGLLQYVESQEAQSRIKSSSSVDFGGNPEWNHEAMIEASFRAFCIYPYGNPLQGEEWAKSLPVVPILEYTERTPLGRAEWMNVFAWMVGEAALIQSRKAFDQIAKRYQQFQNQPFEVSDSLVVFTGSVDQGKWTAPSGSSFIARILKDAGAHYVFADEKGPENIHVPLEQIVELSDQADAWGVVMFQPDTNPITLDDLVAQNPQNALIIPDSGRVFIANTAECDYFGWWVAHPDEMLRNLRELFYGMNLTVQAIDTNMAPETKPCFRWIQE